MRFVSWSEVAERFRGKRVAIVGSAPSVLDNAPGFVDAHEVVVRVNNWKPSANAGKRCDVHYSFFGTSIRKTAKDLKDAGVTLCICKLPNSKPLSSPWHEQRGKMVGIDYRYIYAHRADWWPCDVFIPDDERFLAKMRMLDGHQPTTGFAAIIDVLACGPKSVTLTGFDFFSSGLHNVDEPWKAGDASDPIRHRPDLEAKALVGLAREHTLTLDKKLAGILADVRLDAYRQ